MMRFIKVAALLLVLTLICMVPSYCGGAPSRNPWHRYDSIYIRDLPSGDQIFIPLKCKIWGDPVRCHFGAKVSPEMILSLVEDQIGASIKISIFKSSDDVKGYLLEIPGDHTIFQNFYATGRDYHKEGLMEYEMQGCDVMLVPDGDVERETMIMFPLVVLDTPYDDYSFYPEQLQTDKPYKLIETDIEGIITDYPELLEEFYDKLECYSVERISNEELLVTADAEYIKSLYSLHDYNSPSRSFYLGSFVIKVRDGSVYFKIWQ
ncbi:MAG: hypothetical protein II099_01800 [Firmicutes bacterium]|nr:hypothetical protein [Bacillota bacterium]